MKILKIKPIELDGKKIIVEVEGYPHAQPVFDADITEAELKKKLEEWKINQDNVDRINSEAKFTIQTLTSISPTLLSMINKEI